MRFVQPVAMALGSALFQWAVPVGIEVAMTLATSVLRVIRRLALRLEALQASAARTSPTESDTSGRMRVA